MLPAHYKKTDLNSVGTCLTFVFILKIFYLLFYTTLHSFVRFFSFALKFSKNCAVCVARKLHQADYVNSLCVGNVVEVEMLDSSCALQSVAFHTRLSRLVSVRTLYIYICKGKLLWLYLYNSQTDESHKSIHLMLFA